MKVQDFGFLLVALPAWMVVGYFVRPHWKKMDLSAKFVLGLIPGMLVLSLVVLLVRSALGWGDY